MSDELKLPPFKAFLASNIPSVYDNTLSYYDELTKLLDYIEKQIIPGVNANTEGLKQLKDYVEHYFDNLDVQEEINNKLDAMAEGGELAQIIAIYLTQHLPIDDNFYITTSKVNDGSRVLEYVVTRITPNTSKVDHVPLKGAFAGGSYATAVADTRDYIGETARANNAVLISNCDTIGDIAHRTIIRDGEIVNPDVEYTSDALCLGITDEGELKTYDSTTPTTTLIDDWHIQNSWGGHLLMLNGESREDLWHIDDDQKNNRYPRTIICQEFNSKDIVFFHVAGRRTDSVGLTYAEAVTFVTSMLPNVNIAYMFGSGGDTQLMYKGEMKNDCSDGAIRPLWDFIYLDANIDYNLYANMEKEIADGRNTDYTIHELLDTFLPHDFTYLASQKILTAVYTNATNCFNCNVDYNTNLKDGDSVLIKFGDMSDAGIDAQTRVKLNIHYNNTNAALYLNTEYGNRPVYPAEIKNKIVVVKWDATAGHYKLANNGIVEYFGSSTSLNDITTEGIFYSNNFTNKPSADSQNGWFVNITRAERLNTFVQFYIERPSSKLWMRNVEEGTAGSWKQVAFTDEILLNFPEVYTTDDDPNKDLNNFNNGKTRIAYSYNPNNRPDDADSGWIINIPRSDQNPTAYAVQVYFDRGTSSHGNMYFRQQENSTWTSWKKVSTS